MNDQALRPFHLAIVVDDLAAARSFYGGLLGCAEGRSAQEWVDFDFFGHQLVCHLAPGQGSAGGSANGSPPDSSRTAASNIVDGHGVPVPHFGLVLDVPAFERTRDRLVAAGIDFIVEPHVRFSGQPGEQHTMFFRDPTGNNIEIKAFASLGQLFAT